MLQVGLGACCRRLRGCCSWCVAGTYAAHHILPQMECEMPYAIRSPILRDEVATAWQSRCPFALLFISKHPHTVECSRTAGGTCKRLEHADRHLESNLLTPEQFRY